MLNALNAHKKNNINEMILKQGNQMIPKGQYIKKSQENFKEGAKEIEKQKQGKKTDIFAAQELEFI